MKKLLEIVLCILHPVAVVLIWINLLFGRRDLGLIAKLAGALLRSCRSCRSSTC